MSGRRWIWADVKLPLFRCPHWPMSPARPWWSAGQLSVPDSARNSGSARMLTSACDCTGPAGGCATCPAPGWAIVTAPAFVAGSGSEPATGPGGGTGLAAPRPDTSAACICVVGRRVCACAPRTAGPDRCRRRSDGVRSATPDPRDTRRGHPRESWHAADAGGGARQRRTTNGLHYQALLAGGRTRGIDEPAGTTRARQLRRDRGAARLPAERFEPESPHLPDDPAPGRYGLRRGPMAWRDTLPHCRTFGPAARPA